MLVTTKFQSPMPARKPALLEGEQDRREERIRDGPEILFDPVRDTGRAPQHQRL
ncbi:hypothetical protein AB0G04_25640 [Actinoplanes sp. NPDC023801]|uniref:hypothetical protein n=1 Tax=Actinoplanes sp. NPDC023801 TaxID=3154595 RepID=UPI0033CD5628